MIRLRAAPKPRCRLGSTKRTLGSWMLLKIELLSSVDPSSTTTSSQSDQLWAKILRRQSRRNGPALYTGSPMVKMGDGMRWQGRSPSAVKESYVKLHRRALISYHKVTHRRPDRTLSVPSRPVVIVPVAALRIVIIVVQVRRTQIHGIHYDSHDCCVDLVERISSAADGVFGGLSGTNDHDHRVGFRRQYHCVGD